ncbi:MAG: 2Fe-2S iron-sulfur cluster-binding protein [Planctomycetota bacterium]
MARITYTTPSGEEIVVDAEGGSLMTNAVENSVEGIEGACGGVGACATCHVHVDPDWTEKVGPPNDAEADMLELDDNFADNSRLGCQVPVTPELDGLKVRVVTDG